MTTGHHSPNSRPLRWALALYPASYGAGARAEVAEHAERHLARVGRLAGLREVADVAGHGARVRFGLTSHRPLGRALATAAPLAAVLAATHALVLGNQAVRLAADPLSDPGVHWTGPIVAMALLVAAPVLMAAAALLGRWAAARILAAATVLTTVLVHVLGRPDLLGTSVSPEAAFALHRSSLALIALNAVLLLAAPPDRTHPRSIAPWLVAGSVVAATALMILTAPLGPENSLTGFDLLAPVATGVAIACTARTAGRAAMATAFLSAPLLLAFLLIPGAFQTPLLQRVTVLYAVGFVTAFGVVRLTDRLSRRSGLSRP
ncbi:hypothetical protein OH807_01515 [Kitasatospora sp. NBC_01560]|uniref:hypothetical protein n=1 Tax=Kitasatospora sp. NBC_01560 TaxID=2975965 RepID=UPI0038658D19